ncbi:hydrogenase maturation protein HypC [Hydrogenivirga caldilitoris]|uniref:Hydrogenase maturation protein HypC n=1 Tax=Hydrogenivirga caldilitoris TaxID=246264 RepID=A0A497XQF0_9AQUI|nr:HypC/HybG/HupF family hydrogenase formation chaperone [Hydrogenivirga caldilitoris]RLJ70359.1 hydrogenase maturation protein HypC [Hydrogenivirga caldilitoris]
MCLAIPSKIVELHEDGTATVDTMGVKRKISLELMAEDVGVGDYVLVHVGFAIQKLNEEEALKSLELFEEILSELEEEEQLYGEFGEPDRPQERV